MLLRNFEAFIEVLKSSNPDIWERLPEYKPVPGPASVECHVESTSGQRFRISWRDLRPAHDRGDVVGDICVDGAVIQSTISEQTKIPALLCISEGRRISPTKLVPYTFDKLQTSDDDAAVNVDEELVQCVGMLNVKLYRGVTGVPMDDNYDYGTSPAAAVFHEQNKKATLAHNVHFGSVQAVPPTRYLDFEYTDPDDTPHAMFSFKYRSGDILELEGTRPVSAPPATPSTPAKAVDVKPDPSRLVKSSRPVPFSLQAEEPGISIKKSLKAKEELLEERIGQDESKKRSHVVIDVDALEDSDDESKVAALREDVKRLGKKVKSKHSSVTGEVIYISD